MQIGFFTVVRRDPQHFLHADALVRSARRVMPDVAITQLTDERTPRVPGVDHVRRLPPGPMLERRLEHYSRCDGDWLLIDTDVELLADVRHIFPPTPFDIALADRAWPHLTQGDEVLHTMPFNTGVCFTRNRLVWSAALDVWRGYPPEQRDWLSEQRAVYEVIRTGQFLVRILPGMQYNYPPMRVDDPMTDVKIAHFKGPRKAWLTERYYASLRGAATPVSIEEPACV